MKFHHPLLYLAMAVAFTACDNDDHQPDDDRKPDVNNTNRNVVKNGQRQEILRLEFPNMNHDGADNTLIIHEASVPEGNDRVNYATEWNTALKANRWSCYQMYATNQVSRTSRYKIEYGTSAYWSEQYPTDPALSAGQGWTSGKDTDPYWGSSYSHGHICPSADRLYSATANKQTFYLTNMAPMKQNFNAGVWGNMENRLRSWMNKNSPKTDTLYVCKGGTIDNPTHYTVSNRGLPIPKYFFCALLMKNAQGYKAIGFWFEHKPNKDTNLGKYAVNIHELERLTKLDFFCNLPDDIENKVESLADDSMKRAWGL